MRIETNFRNFRDPTVYGDANQRPELPSERLRPMFLQIFRMLLGKASYRNLLCISSIETLSSRVIAKIKLFS